MLIHLLLRRLLQRVSSAKFGASDVQDLNWVQLLNAYTCTDVVVVLFLSSKYNG
jgi:hypothetical protein